MRVLFIGEGNTDNGIAPHIENYAARQRIRIALTVPDLGLLPGRVGHSVSDKLRGVRDLGGTYDLLILHRDADRSGSESRREEIRAAVEETWPGVSHVSAVPVRMLEAWLLLDESVIRRVAENPRGKVELSLPSPSAAERIADPKAQLKETLARASELKGRRLEQFQKRFPQHQRRLLELLDPAGRISLLPSWQSFVADLQAAYAAWIEQDPENRGPSDEEEPWQEPG
jgi:hypothetical protein